MPFRLLTVLVLALSFNVFAAGGVRVKGHTRKDGAYVPSHSRTKADGSKANNWSTKGNSNPYTGKEGTK